MSAKDCAGAGMQQVHPGLLKAKGMPHQGHLWPEPTTTRHRVVCGERCCAASAVSSVAASSPVHRGLSGSVSGLLIKFRGNWVILLFWRYDNIGEGWGCSCCSVRSKVPFLPWECSELRHCFAWLLNFKPLWFLAVTRVFGIWAQHGSQRATPTKTAGPFVRNRWQCVYFLAKG